MACPPGGCASIQASRLCRPLPPIKLDGAYTPGEIQLLWYCWRARSTGEYINGDPILIEIPLDSNTSQIVDYCKSRGTLKEQFTTFNRFGFKFDLFNFRSQGVISGGFGGGQGEELLGQVPAGGGGGGVGPGPPLAISGDTEMDCVEAGDKELIFTASGGQPPYTWELTGPGTLVQNGSNNDTATITPAASATVAGEAYAWCGSGVVSDNPIRCNGIGGSCDTPVTIRYGCEDEFESCGIGGTCNCPVALSRIHCCCRSTDCSPSGCADICQCVDGVGGSICTLLRTARCAACGPNDIRTQAMIDAGCLPCGVQFDGETLTVTDALGQEVSVTIGVL